MLASSTGREGDMRAHGQLKHLTVAFCLMLLSSSQACGIQTT